MIKSNLPILLAKKRINISDVSRDTGLSRATLSSLFHESGKGVKFETLSKLCSYLECGVGEILEYEKSENIA
ncbi:helix-turn-helix domain-containing protein [Bacillus chungangensis]|uniref:Transcriptional regulator n=1 Tax=Bacillus chungangensis TaxID=587633 RepID=A0ABT9WS92_9BACI|nr:helix-turn-helix transcriptional regulator [Bacillus chungangensis]MDQ0175984.1 putative transcriptional regulator [Bacillus chungangensis]